MRLQALDLLRFLAAMAVVFYHYTARPEQNSFPALAQITQFGYLGVPLFFMISGFVIAASAERRSPAQFVISRAARLYPAYWICIIFTAACLWWLAPGKISLSQVLINFTMLNDYLGVANVDGVYWTLQVELKFYACVLILLCLGQLHRYELWLPIWLALTLVYLMSGQPSAMTWFINPGYSPFFISGIAFYLLWSNRLTLISLIVLCCSTLLCLYQTYQQAKGFMAHSEHSDWLWAASATALFHCLFLLLARHRLNLKTRAIYPVLGGLTYPLYLLHNNAGKVIIERLGNALSDWQAVSITTCGMLLLSYLIYHFVEPGGAKLLKHQLSRLLQQPPPTTNRTTEP